MAYNQVALVLKSLENTLGFPIFRCIVFSRCTSRIEKSQSIEALAFTAKCKSHERHEPSMKPSCISNRHKYMQSQFICVAFLRAFHYEPSITGPECITQLNQILLPKGGDPAPERNKPILTATKQFCLTMLPLSFKKIH